jgi:hypothetical protein
MQFLFCYITGKAIGLPDEFLAFAEGSKGGGVIQVRRNPSEQSSLRS